jgi:hypothetical protein
MPWDACELHVADIGADGSLAPAATKVAGGAGESIFQPAWSPAGILHFVSDRSGFSNLYRVDSDGGAAPASARPRRNSPRRLWVFGLSTYAWLDGETIVCVFQKSGFWHLARWQPKPAGSTPSPPISPSWDRSSPSAAARCSWAAPPRKPRRSIP